MLKFSLKSDSGYRMGSLLTAWVPFYPVQLLRRHVRDGPAFLVG
jgi:hypothetical protein